MDLKFKEIFKESDHPALQMRLDREASKQNSSLQTPSDMAQDLWKMMSKAKSDIQNGRRVENLSWRLMSINLQKQSNLSNNATPSGVSAYNKFSPSPLTPHSNPHSSDNVSLNSGTPDQKSDPNCLMNTLPSYSVPTDTSGSSMMELNYLQRVVRKSSFNEASAKSKKRPITSSHFPSSDVDFSMDLDSHPFSSPKIHASDSFDAAKKSFDHTGPSSFPASAPTDYFNSRPSSSLAAGLQSVPIPSASGMVNPANPHMNSATTPISRQSDVDVLGLDFDMTPSEPSSSFQDNNGFPSFVDAGTNHDDGLFSSSAATSFSFEHGPSSFPVPGSISTGSLRGHAPSEEGFGTSYNSQNLYGISSPLSAGMTPTQSFFPEPANNNVFDLPKQATDMSSPLAPSSGSFSNLSSLHMASSLPNSASHAGIRRSSMFRNGPNRSVANMAQPVDLNQDQNESVGSAFQRNTEWTGTGAESNGIGSNNSLPGSDMFSPPFMRVGTAMGAAPLRNNSVSSFTHNYIHQSSPQFAAVPHRKVNSQEPTLMGSSPGIYNHMPYLNRSTSSTSVAGASVEGMSTGMKKRASATGAVPSHPLLNPNVDHLPDPSAKEKPTEDKKENTQKGMSGTPTCTNCQTHTTPLWRRSPDGQPLCNACGLFMKINGVVRPLSLKTDVIKKRNRGAGSNASVPASRSATPRKSAPRKSGSKPSSSNKSVAKEEVKVKTVTGQKSYSPGLTQQPGSNDDSLMVDRRTSVESPVMQDPSVRQPSAIVSPEFAQSSNEYGMPFNKGMSSANNMRESSVGKIKSEAPQSVNSPLFDTFDTDYGMPSIADPQAMGVDATDLHRVSKPSWDWYSVM
ncbi:transcription factor Gaf1 [Schizosaccharomyces octosporus yFS286]|uniref:Transcription factor Gaf1 n=1 Tax=Schizosaccharomyces octosporus (strain yFS286) TaxID=483514 RepID=S9R9K8_SCHOY|nr:transcription factor Gaf1 [Schizosaccharomyces octosporus yFS286]EPX70829.1 transcription factor Gaf1 [Schizosaccharomyces octosporus yFS286]